MELGTFTPRPREEFEGDRLQAKEAVDRPFIVLVREHRTGVKTKFNSDPTKDSYKPDGQGGITVDVADVNLDQVFIGVFWLNGAVVDDLAPYVGQAVPVKLQWKPSNGNPFIGVTPLEGSELAAASKWASANPTRFDTERAQRASQSTNGNHGAPQVSVPAQATAPTAPAAAPAINTNDPAVAALLAQLASAQQQ